MSWKVPVEGVGRPASSRRLFSRVPGVGRPEGRETFSFHSTLT